MVKCPNKNLPEWKELVRVLGENEAYYIWDQNNGYGLDKAPNGAESKLFSDLLQHYNGDRDLAIRAKANVYSKAFKNWFGDWVNTELYDDSDLSNPVLLKNNSISKVVDQNGEPLIVQHNSHNGQFDTFVIPDYDFYEYDERAQQYIPTHSLPTGTFFTTDENYAKAFGTTKYMSFLNIKNPIWDNNINSEGVANFRDFDEYMSKIHNRELIDGIIGHDAKTLNNFKSKGQEYVVFNPNQIKSIDNVGTFSTENNNIYNQIPYYSNQEKIFNLNNIDYDLVDVEEHDKPWKHDASRVNKTVRIYLKGQHEKGYFELVKDEEYKYYSVHFKTSTEKTGSLTTSNGEKSIPSTSEERKILWNQLINLIPDGSFVSTWGELSDDGIYALNKFGRFEGFSKVGERQVSKKKSNQKIIIPIWQKENNTISQVDELTTDVDPVYIKDSMFAFEEQSGTQTLTAMKASDLFFESQEMRAIADRFTNIDGIKVVLTNDNTYVMQYDANTRTIKVSSDAFYTQDPNYLGRAFLHELVHDYTVYEYQNNSKFARKINKLFDKVSSKFPSDKYGRKGLYYGLSKQEEFISEIYTNAAFRELVLKNSASIWQKFLSTILDMLGLNTLANKINDSKVNSVINSITRIIDKRNVDPTLNDLGDGVFNMNTDIIDDLNKEATKISENILRGMKARNRSLRSRGYSPVKLEQMEQELNQMQELFDKQEFKKLTFDFIKQASVSFKPSLVFIREAYLDPSKITNERLLQFKEDFLEFYGPIVNSISTELFLQDFFDDLSPENINMLQQNIEMIEMAYKEMKGKYDKLVKVKTVEFIRDYFVQNGLDVEEAEKYINDILNSTNTDITQLATIIRSNKTVGDLGMRTMYKIMTEINDDVQKFANEKAQKVLRVFEKLSKSEIRMFYEVDDDGKATGYLVRDLKYGAFKKDLHNFLSNLDTKYGVIDGNVSSLDDDKLKAYQLEKEEWLATHCERKFKPAYYKAYLELKPKTKEKLESLNGEISSIIATVTDENGIHLEKLSNEQWKSLDAFYNLRRNLANRYHSNGVLKTGEELEIAEDLKKFYDVTGNGNIRSVTFSNDEVIKIAEKKKAELSPEDYAKWERRSISIRYSDSFIEKLQNLAKKDYGSDAKKYQELVDRRNELRSLGRDNNNPYTDSNKLHENVKKKIIELDEEIYRLSKSHKGGTKPDDLPFVFEKTPQYEADKARMKALGGEAYRKWHKENHLSNGQPASYYTRMMPKEQSDFELRLNMANRELDKDSPLVNKNYDFDSPEYYQPKRSLYDNSQTYAKALATQEQKDAYNLILDIMTEANNKITFMKQRDAYKLPQITGDIIDFAFRNNSFFKGIKDYFGDGMVANADDVEYALDSYTQKPDGTKLNFIDTHYIQMLKKPEYISRNLAAIIVEYARMAENYKQKQAKQADFELFAAQLANRDFEDVSILTKSRSRKKGINTNKYKMYYNFLEMDLYGQFRSPLSFTIGNKQYSLTKVIDNIRNYASTANLSNNFGALGKALFQGLHKSVVEAIGGRYYSADDYFYALGRNLLKMPKMLWNLGNVKHNDLTLALMEANGISRDSRQKTQNYQYIRPVRVALNYLIWGGWSFVDYIVKAPVVEAIYKDYKLDPTTQTFMSKRKFIRTYYGDNWKEGSKEFNMLDTPTLLDAYEVKNGVPVLKDEYKDKVTSAVTSGITAVATHMTNRIDGVLSQEDKTKIMAHALGGALFMHRSFYIVNLDEAVFTDHQYNPYVDDYVEAKYKSGFRAIFKWLANVAKFVPFISYRGQKINSVEAYNVKKIISQLSLVAIYAILSAVWLKPAADDDKDNWLKQYINYIVSAVVFDERSEYNPLDVVNKIKSPSAVFGPIETIISLGDLINPFRFDEVYSDDVIQKGHYEDMYIWQKNLLKSVPGVRGVIESRDMRTKQQYLDSQIKK